MATEDFSSIGDMIRKAGEALAETLSAVNKAVKDLAAQAAAAPTANRWSRTGYAPRG